jgi:TusA-related sulfurtransferase
MSDTRIRDAEAQPPWHPLDARHLLCPLPVIRLQRLLRTLPEGSRVEVAATDPGVMHDIPAWCRVHGHRVLEARQDGIEYRVMVEAGRPPD